VPTALKTKPGINGANVLSIPKDWDATWFRKFINNSLKGADVRNAIGAGGIVITGNIASPYATISTGGSSPATFASLVVGTPTGGNEGPGSINAQSIFINGVAVSAGPAGPNTAIQFNNGGVFGGSANLEWNGTTLVVNGSSSGIPVCSFAGNSTGIPVNFMDVNVAPSSLTSATIGVCTAAGGITGIAGDLIFSPRTSNACAIIFATGNGTAVNRLTIGPAGNVAVNAPSSGTNLTVAGNSGAIAITAGLTNIGDTVGGGAGSNIFTTSTNQMNVGTVGAASLHLFTNDADRLVIASTGAVSISAPSSGKALTLTSVAGDYALLINSSPSTGNSFGAEILGGTNSSDSCAYFGNQAGGQLMRIDGAGGVQVGSPTGAGQGLGTLNATGLFVNGVALAAPAVVVKPALTSRASNVAPTNDGDLVLSISATGTYRVEVVAPFYNTASATAGFKCNVNYSGTFTAAASNILFTTGVAAAASANIASAQATVINSGNCGGSSAAPNVVYGIGQIVVTGAGTLGFSWSQNNTNATGTVLSQGAYLQITKIA
jgi:hypothetical protein